MDGGGTSFPRGGEIRTRRLVLRPLRAEDLPAFVAYRREPAVARFQTWDTEYSLADAERLLAELEAARGDALGAGVQLAVADCGDGALVGDCFGRRLTDPADAVEVGVTLAPGYQGRGLATEALTALVQALLRTPGVGRILARTDERNRAARRVFERVGFHCVPGPGEAEWLKGELTTVRVYVRAGA